MTHDSLELAFVPAPNADTIDPRALAQRSQPAAARAGPGWFDSSWDLRRGLHVTEGWPRDASLGTVS